MEVTLTFKTYQKYKFSHDACSGLANTVSLVLYICSKGLSKRIFLLICIRLTTFFGGGVWMGERKFSWFGLIQLSYKTGIFESNYKMEKG